MNQSMERSMDGWIVRGMRAWIHQSIDRSIGPLENANEYREGTLESDVFPNKALSLLMDGIGSIDRSIDGWMDGWIDRSIF